MASGTSADEEVRAAHSEVPAHPGREVYWPGLGRGEWIAWENGPANAVAWVLALAFAAHQVFESYTMFRWVIGSAVAAMSIGYVGFGEWED